MTERPQISRRRLIVGTGVGAAALWAAPAVTTLSSAHAAGSHCSVFSFVTENLASGPPSPPGPPYSGTYGVGQVFVAGGTLTVTTGDVDLVGPGTPWSSGFTNELSMDLNGSTGTTTTILTGGGALIPGSYTVEVDVYGSVGGDTNNIRVAIGGVDLVGPVGVGPGVGTLHALSGSNGAVGGLITLTHTSTSDNQGLFLKRLEVFQEYC